MPDSDFAAPGIRTPDMLIQGFKSRISTRPNWKSGWPFEAWIKELRNSQGQGIFLNMLQLRFWDDFRTDLRYAIRTLIKSPGFTAIAIGSLALGIGANTVIFTFAKQVLFDRLAVPHPEELRLLTWTDPEHSIVAH